MKPPIGTQPDEEAPPPRPPKPGALCIRCQSYINDIQSGRNVRIMEVSLGSIYVPRILGI